MFLIRLSCWNNEWSSDESSLEIDLWLSWSFYWSMEGVHPARDPYGRYFSKEYTPQLFDVAGQRIAGNYKFILSGHRGDLQYYESCLK
jgi:hypothetical protein